MLYQSRNLIISEETVHILSVEIAPVIKARNEHTGMEEGTFVLAL